MSEVVTNPCAEDIRHAGAEFDEQNKYCEGSLTELFTKFPGNTDHAHVYLKALTLNALYSTQIPLYNSQVPALWEIAELIVKREIDEGLNQGLPEMVGQIAAADVPGKKHRYNYSFATKYCSWQRPDVYPIFDSRVNEYLWHLRNLGILKHFKRDSLWDYPVFREIVIQFREKFSLKMFTFKELDKFLYQEGGKLLTVRSNMTQSEVEPDSPTGIRS
jgi:hypothetical protein